MFMYGPHVCWNVLLILCKDSTNLCGVNTEDDNETRTVFVMAYYRSHKR